MKTLTAIIASTALTLLPMKANSLPLWPDGTPLTASSFTIDSISDVGELVEGIPRATVTEGKGMSPRWACLGEMVDYTTLVINLSEGETSVDALRDLESLVIPTIFLSDLQEELFLGYGSSPFSESFYQDGILTEPGALVVTRYGECPEPPFLPKPKYLEGKVVNPRMNARFTVFTLDAYLDLYHGRVLVPNGIRLDAGETVRLYHSKGFPSSGAISEFEKMEVVDDKGEVKVSYQPANFSLSD